MTWFQRQEGGGPPLLAPRQLVALGALALALPLIDQWARPLLWPGISLLVFMVGFTFIPLLRGVSWKLRGVAVAVPLWLAAAMGATSYALTITPIHQLWGAGILGLALASLAHRRIKVLLNPKMLELLGPVTGVNAVSGALIALFTTVGEELFFRGYLAPATAQLTNLLLACILNAAIFSGQHWLHRDRESRTGIDYVALGALGLISSWSYLTGNSITWSITLHAAYNFTAIARPILVWLVSRPSQEKGAQS